MSDIASAIEQSGICLLNMSADGHVTGWNEAFLAASGYDAAALEGMHLTTLFADAAPLDSAQSPIDMALLRRDGRPVWMSAAIAPKEDGGSLLLLTDNDARVRREADAAREAALVASFFERLPEGFMILRAVRAADGAIVDFEWKSVNPAAAKIVDRDDLPGKRLLVEMPGNREAGLFAAYCAVVETGVPWQSEFAYHYEGMDAWFRSTATKFGDGFAVAFADITEARRARSALEASEAFTRHVLDNLFTFVGVLDRDGKLTIVNKAPLDAAGLSEADVIGREFWDCYWWSHDPAAQDQLREAFATALGGELVRYDTQVRIAGDHRLWIDFQMAPLRDRDGRVTHVIPSGIDISQRKEKEQRIDVLLAEVNHRAKNHLAVVQSVARQTARSSSPERFVTDLINRMQGLASSQDLMIASRWRSIDLHSLIEAQLRHFGEAATSRITVAGPSFEIAPEAAQGIGMALHELASNAVRHGALSEPAGRVALGWSITDQPSGRTFDMFWIERHGPPVSQPKRAGFGRTVIERLSAHAVGGKVEMAFAEEGLRWRLTAPYAPLVTAGRVYRIDLDQG